MAIERANIPAPKDISIMEWIDARRYLHDLWKKLLIESNSAPQDPNGDIAAGRGASNPDYIMWLGF